MASDESSECVYITAQAISVNMIDSTPVMAIVNQQSNALVQDVSEWNLYVASLTLQTTNIPYFNIQRNIQWDAANYTTGKTNFSITLVDSTGATPFNEVTDPVMFNVTTPIAGKTTGVGCFLQYISENNGSLLNPTDIGFVTSANYPRDYFDVHSIQQFLDMVNRALVKIINLHATLVGEEPYFIYNSTAQSYSLMMPTAFNIAPVDIYFNGFLERQFDAFRTKFISHSNVQAAGYTGMSFKFIKSIFILPTAVVQPTGTVFIYVYNSESSSINNLYDIHSVVITCGGSLAAINPEVVPSGVNQANFIYPQTLPCLKNLDFDFSSLSMSSINNTFIQYEATNLCRPLRTKNKGPLNSLVFNMYVQNNDDTLYPIYIPSFGLCNIKFVLKKIKQTK